MQLVLSLKNAFSCRELRPSRLQNRMYVGILLLQPSVVRAVEMREKSFNITDSQTQCNKRYIIPNRKDNLP
jgi:hypothetical protein